MPATDSDLTTMEDEKGGPADPPASAAPAAMIVSPPFPATMSNFAGETQMENRAVSMASPNCSSALSSPAEASPAKPAVTSPNTLDGSVETSPPTSNIASASDSLKCTVTNLVNTTDSLLLMSKFPLSKFGGSEQKNDFSSVLTFKGVTVSLENNSVWKQFNSCGTEMILTKQGRRMFPYCRYRLSGLDPENRYILVLSFLPADQFKYRWNKSRWEVSGPAENQTQGLTRAFGHHYSACKGSVWMGGLISFYKLKLTNNFQDQEGHIVLHTMHRYIPQLHVIPVLDGVTIAPDQPVVMGSESMSFTFPQTEFMAVTTYQNIQITQLKINHNPFARGFREDGNSPRQVPAKTEGQSAVKTEEPNHSKEGTVDVSAENRQECRLVLKPIMSTPSDKNKPYVSCLRGNHALGELVLVQKSPPEESTEAKLHNSVTPESQHRLKPPTPSKTSPGSSPRTRRKRKKMTRRFVNRGKEWKCAAAAPPKVVHSPSLAVALQPELDEVEGLLFVSFASKEALEVHVRNKPPSNTAPVSPVSQTTQKQLKQTEELIPATDEESIAQKEAVLLQDLRVFKHRQVIHPVLQEVGLKLSALNSSKSVDLQYVGVHLPLPPANLPEQVTSASLGETGLPFISRTGKTSDMTKIKGWKNKFIKTKESSLSADGSQKNLSAFCSDLLDEYLESEAQQISERAAAFSTSPEGSVAYQLPSKGSSYVKTLDSVLKHRNPASRPCPLSQKPLLYSALMAQPPPLPSLAAPAQAKSPSTLTEDADAASGSSAFSHRSSPNQPASFGQNQATAHRPVGLSKFQWTQMKGRALNGGLRGTRLTQDRLTMALSVLLTKQMHISSLKVQRPQSKDAGPACGQEFCRLGCLCSSLLHLNRGPLHCRRPECMFDCACKITQHISGGETEPDRQPASLEPVQGSRTYKLWQRNVYDVDTEPMSVPECPQYVEKTWKRSSPTQPMREEEKDPVYKYLESMLTCARVRGVYSKTPPKVSLEPKIPDAPTGDIVMKQKTASGDLQRELPSSLKKRAETTALEQTAAVVRKAKTQIQIQSTCQWKQDDKMVLQALCQHLNQKKMSQRFRIGPYLIVPLSKISMQKPSGWTVTYRVRISKPSKASDNEEEDECDDSDEEKPVDERTNAQEEDDLSEELRDMRVGVTPFLGGILPAGKLKATTKPPGSQACALIQVNGKSYNHAKLLLGNMGSLHPANRLASYVTGRHLAPAAFTHTRSQKPEDSAPGNNRKVPTPSSVPLHLNSWRKASTNPPQHLQNSSWINPVQTFISNQFSPFGPVQKPLPVSITVSPSLKTPSFLGQSGTYSFRICPPASESSGGQNRQGVALPGGFTIIDLTQPGSSDAPQPSESLKTTNMAAVKNESPTQRDWDASSHSLDTRASSKLAGGDHANSRCEESNMDFTSEYLNSEDSDDYIDRAEEEQTVDIETIEEGGQEKANAKMKARLKTPQEPRCPSLSESSPDPKVTLSTEDKKKRKNHSAFERQRRSKQRILFNKLQSILCPDLVGTKPPRLHLLSVAVMEVQNLADLSKFLKEKKRKLAQLQSQYVKRLSMLSGKSEVAITEQLHAICRKQKMKEEKKQWSPFFSRLLQSRAALLQKEGSNSQCTSPSLPDFNPHDTAAQTDAALISPPPGVNPPKPLFTPLLYPQAASTPAKAVLTAASSQGENQEHPGAPAQGSVPNSQSQALTSQVIPPTTTTTTTPNPPNSSTKPLPSISLPLIRSRDGRLILPACMKPGFFTLMLMEAQRKTGDNGVCTLADVDKNQEKSLSSSDQPSASESSRGLEERTSSLNSDPKSPHPPSPVLELKLLNKVDVQDKLKGGEATGLSETLTALLPPGGRHRRGRPPKKQAVDSLAEASDAGDSPVPAKRRRGRPSKQRQRGERRTPAAQRKSSKSDEGSPVKPSYLCRSRTTEAAGNTSRPLTRGALGKDLPSAKRRSWIDIEKELDRELESE